MTAQRGKDLLLKVDSDGLGSFSTIAGVRSNTLSFNARTVDITSSESAGEWRELLAGSGVKSANVSGAGIFKDAAADATARSYFFDGTIRDWQIVLPGFGIVQGLFQVTGLEFAGEHDGEMTYQLTLDSAGLLTFTSI